MSKRCRWSANRNDRYVIADYERSNFSVSQCVFQENNPQRIIPILSPAHSHHSGQSRGALINIIVLSIAFVILIGAGLLAFIKIQSVKGERRAVEQEGSGNDGLEQESVVIINDTSEQLTELYVPLYQEMMGHEKDMRHEVAATEKPTELPAS